MFKKKKKIYCIRSHFNRRKLNRKRMSFSFIGASHASFYFYELHLSALNSNWSLTLRGGGIGLCITPDISISEVMDDILSFDLPFDSRLEPGFGAGGGGFCGLLTRPNLSEFLHSGMTSLFTIQRRYSLVKTVTVVAWGSGQANKQRWTS